MASKWRLCKGLNMQKPRIVKSELIILYASESCKSWWAVTSLWPLGQIPGMNLTFVIYLFLGGTFLHILTGPETVTQARLRDTISLCILLMFLLLFLRGSFQWMILHDGPFSIFVNEMLFFLKGRNSILRVFNNRRRKEWIYTLLMRLSWEIFMYIVVKLSVPLFRLVVLRGCLPY